MKLFITKGSANVSIYIFIQDSSSTTGAGLTGLVYNSAGLVAYYVRPLAAAAALSLATQTVTGAHSDGGFVEISSSNMPGWYRLDLSDAILASGVDSVGVHLKGATNMAPLPIEIQLTNFDVNSATVDVGAISGDATAADNLEAQYDTTGLAGDTFPATQSQLAGIANVGSASHRPAASYTLTTGTQSANTVAATEPLDGTRHEHTDDAGAMELYYEFLIGAGTPSSVQVTGYLTGPNDSLGIYGYDWVATAWVQIGTMQGSALTIDQVLSLDLFLDMVGTGADIGKVRVRFYAASGLTSATLAIDQIFLAFSQGVGTYNGAIHVNTNGSNTNTVPGTDGIDTNPVSTWAAALTLSGLLNLTRFNITNGSAITLTGNSDNYSIIGQEYTLAFGGQSTAGLYVFGGSVSGIGTGAVLLEDCPVGNVTLPPSIMRRCYYFGTVTNSAAGDWFINDPRSRVAGAGSPVFNFGAAVGDTNLNIRGNSGGWQLEAMGDTGTDTASIEGWGQVIEGTCTAGTVVVRGNFTTSGITNLTLSDDARIDVAQINAECDIALSDFWTSPGDLVSLIWNEMLTKGNYNVGQSGAKMLRELGTLIAAEGAVSGTPTTTVFITNITGYDDDFFVDQVVAAYNGAAQAGQGRVVSAYNGTTGEFTVDEPFTTALQSGDDVVVFTPHVHPITQIQMGLATSAELATHDGKLDDLTVDVATLNDLSAAEVNAEVDTALNTAIPGSPTAGSVNDVLNDQARSAKTIQKGAAATGTLSTTEMTTDLTVSVADQFNGRIIIFANDTTTAALRGQATDITDTVVSGGKLIFTALTTAPVDGDTFVVV